MTKKLTLEQAKLTGAYAKNPQRYRKAEALQNTLPPVGPAPKNLSKSGKRAWAEFVKEFPWIRLSDRCALTLLAMLRGQFQDDPASFSAPLFGQYRMLLASFGGTPQTRDKIAPVPDESKDDPTVRYFV